LRPPRNHVSLPLSCSDAVVHVDSGPRLLSISVVGAADQLCLRQSFHVGYMRRPSGPPSSYLAVKLPPWGRPVTGVGRLRTLGPPAGWPVTCSCAHPLAAVASLPRSRPFLLGPFRLRLRHGFCLLCVRTFPWNRVNDETEAEFGRAWARDPSWRTRRRPESPSTSQQPRPLPERKNGALRSRRSFNPARPQRA